MGGSCSTTVANAYHTDIFVKVDSERSYLREFAFSANAGVNGEIYYIREV